VEAMQKDSKVKLSKLSLDGGVAANRLVLELHAKILGVEILKPKILEMTGLGALKAAALGVGAFTKISETKLESIYELKVPAAKEKTSDEIYALWKKAVAAVQTF
jgi:glycerol kinase